MRVPPRRARAVALLAAILVATGCGPSRPDPVADGRLDLIGGSWDGEATTIVTLPDGTEAEVVAAGAAVADDVALRVEPDDGRWRVTVVNDRGAPVLVARPSSDTDGPQLSLFEQSLSYARGEWEAPEQPTTPATFVAAGDRHAFAVRIDAEEGSSGPPAVCLQVAPTDDLVTTWEEPERTGDEGRVPLRGAGGQLELACS